MSKSKWPKAVKQPDISPQGDKVSILSINKVATSLGFSIEQFPFPDKLKGRVIIKEGIKVIGVNENHPKTLQRYTIAHELVHYLNGHDHIEKTYINDESRYTDSYFHQEKEADAFAAELLMPKFLLEIDLSEIGLEIDSLKEKYIVSEQALWIRLTSLRLAEKYAKAP